jgi:hypothetical protein
MLVVVVVGSGADLWCCLMLLLLDDGTDKNAAGTTRFHTWPTSNSAHTTLSGAFSKRLFLEQR